MLMYEEAMEIKILRKQGNSLRKIAKSTGRSVNTVRRYLNGAEAVYKRTVLHPSKLDPYKEYIKARLEAAYPEWIPATVILREIASLGYTGRIRILQEYMASLKPIKKPEKVVRFETAPGKQMQVDWAEFKYAAIKLYAFIAVLGYSRATFVEFTLDMKIDTLLKCHENAFEYFGGVPEEILYDNMKTVVIDRNAYGPNKHRFNQQLYDFAKYYGFVPRLCKPYRAKTKGKVERFIGYLRGSFFIPLCATMKQAELGLDLITANTEILKWLNDVANQRIHRTTQKRPAVLLEEERQYLLKVVTNYFKVHNYDSPVMNIIVPQHDLVIYNNIAVRFSI